MFSRTGRGLVPAAIFAVGALFASGAASAAFAAETKALAVQDEVLVPSAGAQIYVEIRGARKNAPVVLFLHEGPANVLGLMAFRAYPGVTMEKDFVMAYMHQRGVLRSPDVPDSTQTVANHLGDIDAVVEYLRKRFGTVRVHLVGHSWGGILAYLYLFEHQDKVGKLVSVCAPFDVPTTVFASYEVTLQWARDTNTQQALVELAGIGSPPYTSHKQLLTKTLWTAETFGGLTRNVDADSVLSYAGFARFDPEWSEEQLRIAEAMFSETQTINVEGRVASLHTPLLLIAGRNDADVPYFTLRSGFEKWGGRKKFVVFEKSHHIPFVDETERFVEEVRTFLLE